MEELVRFDKNTDGVVSNFFETHTQLFTPFRAAAMGLISPVIMEAAFLCPT